MSMLTFSLLAKCSHWPKIQMVLGPELIGTFYLLANLFSNQLSYIFSSFSSSFSLTPCLVVKLRKSVNTVTLNNNK